VSGPEFVGDPLRILDLDVECRPLSWYGGDWVTKEITGIACQWLDRKRAECWVLTEEPGSMLVMLVAFRERYDLADMCTGHFIRGFDLPLLNGMMIDNGLPPLAKKLTHDTKLDLMKMQGLSKSQENLAALLGLKHPKVKMNQALWREANRLTPEGIALTRKRVVGDVKQHIEMRARLLELGMLGPPKLWAPGAGGGLAGYEA